MAGMPHTFDGCGESPASVEQIHTAFGREDYWLARLAVDADTTTLDSLDVHPDGTVTVQVTQRLGRQLLPGPIANVVRGELKLVNTETWVRDGDRHVRGQILTSASGGLGSCRAETWLAPAGNGSQLRFTGRVEVRIPLLGGMFEKYIGANLTQNVLAVMEFTTAWIAEKA
jgi:hypothetical protein